MAFLGVWGLTGVACGVLPAGLDHKPCSAIAAISSWARIGFCLSPAFFGLAFPVAALPAGLVHKPCSAGVARLCGGFRSVNWRLGLDGAMRQVAPAGIRTSPF